MTSTTLLSMIASRFLAGCERKSCYVRLQAMTSSQTIQGLGLTFDLLALKSIALFTRLIYGLAAQIDSKLALGSNLPPLNPFLILTSKELCSRDYQAT